MTHCYSNPDHHGRQTQFGAALKVWRVHSIHLANRSRAYGMGAWHGIVHHVAGHQACRKTPYKAGSAKADAYLLGLRFGWRVSRAAAHRMHEEAR